MGMKLDELRTPPPDADLDAADWAEHVRVGELPPELLRSGDHSVFHVVVGRLDGEAVATAIAFDHHGDCGIYNVGTLEHARRRGLATALTARLLHDALARGCETASAQATEMAEHVYAASGFRDLGRFLEYVPPARGR
jgi:predicted GNAT family acetyltransferase